MGFSVPTLGYWGPATMGKYISLITGTAPLSTVCLLVQDLVNLVRFFRKDAFAVAKDDEIRDVLKCIDAPAEARTCDTRARKRLNKTNTQITQNSPTLLGIACSVPK